MLLHFISFKRLNKREINRQLRVLLLTDCIKCNDRPALSVTYVMFARCDEVFVNFAPLASGQLRLKS